MKHMCRHVSHSRRGEWQLCLSVLLLQGWLKGTIGVGVPAVNMGPEMLQKKLEEEVEAYKKIQKDISKTSGLRTQLDVQLNENKVVKEELELINEENVVYKLIGPALIRQDLEEAHQNVSKRVDYIQQEIKRHGNTIEKLEKDAESKRENISKHQQQLQQMMVKQAAK